MPSAFVFRSLLVVALSLGALTACSSSSDDSATTTSAVGDTTVSSTTEKPTDTSSTTSSVVDTTTSAPSAQDAITVAVYWNRPYGTARPIDIPGYKDPDGGPYPYVLFGSVTNAGSNAISQPQIAVDWYLDGQSIHTTTAPARDAQGGTLPELAAGASADLIVVVDSESIASQLPDAQPSFGLYAP